ncbi:hypothetical protein ACFO4O_04255 [Glaciecola siphonariae]|uniref:Uncharacterized protein n=1 Tax=Glaciecola siphonariae TaxID=521012 RepID=A0ABV9LUR7_9ALTE
MNTKDLLNQTFYNIKTKNSYKIVKVLKTVVQTEKGKKFQRSLLEDAIKNGEVVNQDEIIAKLESEFAEIVNKVLPEIETKFGAEKSEIFANFAESYQAKMFNIQDKDNGNAMFPAHSANKIDEAQRAVRYISGRYSLLVEAENQEQSDAIFEKLLKKTK